MLIVTATHNFLHDVKSLFPEERVEVYDKKNQEHKNPNLVVFTGGEDVSPYLYMDEEQAREIENFTHYSNERDKVESDIFNEIMSGEIKTNRVFGICRGLQFVNVMLNGTLYYDLGREGKSHDGIHNLKHFSGSHLSELGVTNSFHHQAIKLLGDRYESNNGSCYFGHYILAKEPVTGVIEIAAYLPEDRKNFPEIFGVQFHPEFFGEGSSKEYVRKFLLSWANMERSAL